MAKDLVVSLLLKTGAFSDDIVKAKGQINNFKKSVESGTKSVGGFTRALGVNCSGLLSFAAKAGAAYGAGQLLKGIIDSSQSSADAFANAIAGAKGAVSEFGYALSTFDFSGFNNGLSAVITNAVNLQKALDQLGNTKISFDFFTADVDAKMAEYREILSDPDATKEEKNNALKGLKEQNEELKRITTNKNNRVNEYAAAAIKAKDGRFNIDPKDVEKYLRFSLIGDVSSDPQKFRDSIERQFKSVNKEEEEIRKKYNNYSLGNANAITAEGKKKLDELYERNKNVIAAHVLLEKYSDEELQNIANVVKDAKQDNIRVSTNARMINREEKKLNNGNKTSGGSGSGSYKTTKVEKPSMLQSEKDIQINEATLGRDWKYSEEGLEEYRKYFEEKKNLYKEDADALHRVIIEELNYVREYNQNAIKLDTETENAIKKNNENKKTNLRSILDEDLKNIQDYGEDMNMLDSEIIQKEIELWNEYYDALAEIFKDDEEEFKKIQVEKMKTLSGLDRAMKRAFKTEAIDEARNKLADFNTEINSTASILGNISDVFDQIGGNLGDGLSLVFGSLEKVTDCFQDIINLQQEQAMKQLENSAAIQAANIAEIGTEQGKALASGTASAAKLPFPANVAAIASIVGTITSIFGMIASVSRSSGKYASGGIVGGNSFVNDKVMIGVNSGEMVLNTAQQSNLFKMLNGNRMNNNTGMQQVEFHISGQNLVGVLNNNTKKSKVIG